jgi:hypothetical protein
MLSAMTAQLSMPILALPIRVGGGAEDKHETGSSATASAA